MDEVDGSSLQTNISNLSSTPAALWSSIVTSLHRERHLSKQVGLSTVTAPEDGYIWQASGSCGGEPRHLVMVCMKLVTVPSFVPSSRTQAWWSGGCSRC